MNTSLARNLIGLTAVGLLAACATKKAPEAAPAPVPAPAPVVQAPAPAPAPAPVAVDPLNDPNSILSKRAIYFDFDKYDIRDDARPIVNAHGDYLKTHADRKVRIEGNCDERGSREYNLALGQKRSEAAKKAFVVLGAQEAQVEAISNGKEKPKASGHDEQSWQENRRDDFVYNAM